MIKLKKGTHCGRSFFIIKFEIENFKQCPTIVHPVSVNDSSGEVVIIRPFITDDFMHGSFARLPTGFIKELTERLLALGYSAVLYDVSNKPPGTTEHE